MEKKKYWNRRRIVSTIANRLKFSYDDVDMIFKEFDNIIYEAVRNQQEVKMRGLFNIGYTTIKNAGYSMRNPKTGAPADLPNNEYTRIYFKASVILRDIYRPFGKKHYDREVTEDVMYDEEYEEELREEAERKELSSSFDDYEEEE